MIKKIRTKIKTHRQSEFQLDQQTEKEEMQMPSNQPSIEKRELQSKSNQMAVEDTQAAVRTRE